MYSPYLCGALMECPMFLRQAKAGSHTYLRLVENYREGNRVRLTPPRSQRFARSPSGLAGSGAPSRRTSTSVGGGGATLHPPSLDLGTGPGGAPFVRRAGPGTDPGRPPPAVAPWPAFVGARLPSGRLSSDPSRQRACLGRLVGGLLRLQRGREPLAGAVEGVAAGESQLRATEVVVPDPRRPSAGERAHRKRALLPPPRSVQSAAGLGFLRPDLDLLRRPRAGGAGTLRLQPGQQTPSSPDSARGGDDGGLADGPPCLCR